jgi:hypothetical protein
MFKSSIFAIRFNPIREKFFLLINKFIFKYLRCIKTNN